MAESHVGVLPRPTPSPSPKPGDNDVDAYLTWEWVSTWAIIALFITVLVGVIYSARKARNKKNQDGARAPHAGC